MASRLLKKIDLLDGVSKSRFPNLSVPDMMVTVTFECDDALEKLITKGKEGLRWQQLQDAADDAAAPVKKVIAEELKRLNEKVATLSLPEAEEMVAATAHSLKNAAAAQEQAIRKAVEKEWTEAVRRRSTLSGYRWKCGFRVTVGAMAIATSLAALIASCGSALIAAAALSKAITEMALLVCDLCQDVDTAGELLGENLDKLRAKTASEAAKAGLGKEVFSDISPIMGAVMSTVNTCDQAQGKFEAKIASLDKRCDDLVGKLNAGLDKLQAIETREPAKLKRIQELADANQKVLAKVMDLNKELPAYRKANEAARKEIIAWKAARPTGTRVAIYLSIGAKVATGLLAAVRTFGKIAGAPIP